MSTAVDQLKARLTDLRSLGSVSGLLNWDQRVMMPPGGAVHRGEHMALLARLSHQHLTDPELGRLLDEVEGSVEPDSDDAALVRLARRDRAKALRVPVELRSEMARASAASNGVWREAKATSDFALFLPALERNVELRLRYVECFDVGDEPYDVLLDDYEPELGTAEVRAIFDEIKAGVAPLVASGREQEVDTTFLTGRFPIDAQMALDDEVIELFGHRPGTCRLDETEHPFESAAGVDDIRVTTHYYEDSLKSLFSTMHEYGHGLYEHQIPRRFAHLPIGTGCSGAVHESQSRMWENLVGRSRPFWNLLYPRLQEVFPEPFARVDLDRFYAAINKVQPSLIRIRADEVTYGLHIILRFELEQDIVNGRLALHELPEAWAAKMHELLGIEVPDDANGVLQDTHWSSGSFGYFPSYLLGNVMSVQIWERAVAGIGDLDGQMERGEFAPLREWLAENVHVHGKKFTPQETLRRITGSTLDAKPYLAYLTRKYAAS
jgi:carboxypeptidase Taq